MLAKQTLPWSPCKLMWPVVFLANFFIPAFPAYPNYRKVSLTR